MKATEKAYLAGIIDGEGCISIGRNSQHGSYVIRLFIAQHSRELELHKWLRSLGAGCTETYTSIVKYTWSGHKMKPILEATLPYMKVKTRQAKLALRFIDKMPGAGGGRHGLRQPRAWMNSAYWRMRKLNSR